MSGAPSSNSLLRRLLRLMILLYKSFKSEVAKRPPSNWTIGRISGGITGTASRTIHSGRFPDRRKASTTSNRLIFLAFFWPLAFLRLFLSSSASASKSISARSSLIASAPIPTRKFPRPSSEFLYSSVTRRYSASEITSFLLKFVVPGSRTTKEAKYNTFSSAFGDISRINPIRLGIPLKYQIWDTGAASSMCPILSLLTLAFVTSTPHLSQTTPL